MEKDGLNRDIEFSFVLTRLGLSDRVDRIKEFAKG